MLMKKKVFIVASLALASAVVLFIANGDTKNSVEASFEALTSDESNVPTLPCKRATSACEVQMKTTDGKVYISRIAGLENDPPKP